MNYHDDVKILLIISEQLNLYDKKMSEIEELAQFLNIDQRLDIKLTALQHIVGITGSKDGIMAIRLE